MYITEAHAKDEWPIGSQFSACNQPKALEERLALAEDLFGRLGVNNIPAYSDTMANEFEAHYAAWPLRFFILKDGAVQWVSQPSTESFAQPNIAAIERHIMESLVR